jgi:hypothetical protein
MPHPYEFDNVTSFTELTATPIAECMNLVLRLLGRPSPPVVDVWSERLPALAGSESGEASCVGPRCVPGARQPSSQIPVQPALPLTSRLYGVSADKAVRRYIPELDTEGANLVLAEPVD